MGDGISITLELPRLLHIYIPTYNRPKELRKQLLSLASQVDERVKVFVNDNCSTAYDLDALADEFRDKGFVFGRNATNVGANANISYAYPLAGHSRYLWILSDNDILLPGAISQVLEMLSHEPDLLILGKTTVDKVVVEPSGTGWVESCPGLISEAIYRTALFLPQVLAAYLYHNSSFPHLAVYYATKQLHSMRVQYSAAQLFVIEGDLGGAKGEYGLSIAGMPQLVFLFPQKKDRRRFLRTWLFDVGRRHFALKNPSFLVASYVTRKLLWQMIPFAMITFYIKEFVEPAFGRTRLFVKTTLGQVKRLLSPKKQPKI